MQKIVDSGFEVGALSRIKKFPKYWKTWYILADSGQKIPRSIFWANLTNSLTISWQKVSR
jgi:hypothetical protein